MNKLLVICLVIVLLTIACDSSTPTKTTSPEESAYGACIYFIEKQLDLSTRDAQDYESATVTANGNQYKVKVYYAKYKSLYTCTLQHSGDQWQLSGLEVE